MRAISLIVAVAMIWGMAVPNSAQAQTWDSVLVTATVLSPENTFSDTWNFYSLASGGNWEGWNRGEITSDGEGYITDGWLISHEGVPTAITGGTYTVPKVGVVEADFISSKGNIDFKGGMNSQWDVVIGVEKSSPGPDYGWDMLIKSSIQFAQSDFWGTWNFYSLASGGSWEGWRMGTIVSNARGNITGGSMLKNNEGIPVEITEEDSSYTINANGVFTATVKTSDGKTTTLKGSMNDSRDIIGGVDDPADDEPEVWVLVKSTATFTNENFSGKWDFKAATSCDGWEGWREGTIEADNAGGITGGSLEDNKGNSVTITGGSSYTIYADGVFAATLNTSDGKTTTLQGAMNDSKDVAVSVSEATTSVEYGLAGMTRITPSDSGPRDPYLLMQDQGPAGSSDYTTSPTVNVTLDVKNGTQYKLSEDWDFPGEIWTSTSFPLTSPDITYTFAKDKDAGKVVDGIKVLYVRYRNNAGLEGPTISDEIVLDRVPPILESITLSDRTNGSTDKTNEHIVNVDIVASGSPKEIMLSQHKKFKNAEWIDLSAQVTFFLSGGDGKKTVYAKVRDGAGWENVPEGKDPVNDAIELDTTPPSAPSGFIAIWKGTEEEPTKDVDLSWTNPSAEEGEEEDFAYTLIRRQTGGYPKDINDGYSVYDDEDDQGEAGEEMLITDTVPKDGIYYYRAWALDDIENVSLSAWAVVSVNAGPIPPPDPTEPYITDLNPSRDENFVPWDTNIFFHLRDDESGVDRDTITLTVEDQEINLISTDVPVDERQAYQPYALIGGDRWDNIILYDPEEDFKYQEEVTVIVTASNLTHPDDVKTLHDSYTFTTHTMVIGSNVMVEDEGRGGVNLARPSIAVDSNGKNVYVTWEEYNGTDYDIYCAKSANRGSSFGSDVKVYNAEGLNQRHPQIAIDSSKNIYVVWQEEVEGNWRVYLAKSTKGDLRFGTPVQISNGVGTVDQTLPTIDAKSGGKVYVAWVETEWDESSIYFASSTDGGANFGVPERIDFGAASSPTSPSLKISPAGKVFIAWQAKGSEINHIYFDSNRSGSFGADVRVSVGGADATMPSLDVTPNKDVYIAWTNKTDGDADIYFAKMPHTKESFDPSIRVDDDSGAHSQSDPSLVVDNSGDVYIAWRDQRHDDGDIFIAISIDRGSTFKTNVLINRDSSATIQTEPCLALDGSGKHLNVCWTDYRNGKADIYFAKNMVIAPFKSELVKADYPEWTIKADAGNGLDGTTLKIPAGALEVDTTITMGEISGLPPLPAGVKGIGFPVSFGPGGTEFNRPVTIRIPYSRGDLERAGLSSIYDTLDIYLYRHTTDSWEKLAGTVYPDYVEVQVDHFSIFSLGGIAGGAMASIMSGSAIGAECFIATATYGTEMAKEVEYLRKFRDTYLLTNKPGRKFVELYCKFSPPIADHISKREPLKSIVRKLLRPFVWFSKIMTEKK